jgi:hypothetical protein
LKELVAKMKNSLLAAAVCAAVAALSAGPALAGEVTGSHRIGANVDQNQGMSWCSFSGLNDDPGAPLNGPNGPGGTSQSFGQENRLGLQDPRVSNPGTFCNPNRTPLPPQPNRTK